MGVSILQDGMEDVEYGREGDTVVVLVEDHGLDPADVCACGRVDDGAGGVGRGDVERAAGARSVDPAASEGTKSARAAWANLF
jgi:hypothetical protein